jgi:hypothetical protein
LNLSSFPSFLLSFFLFVTTDLSGLLPSTHSLSPHILGNPDPDLSSSQQVMLPCDAGISCH